MAAKVVMVAVPTVLGIASIRVYRVSEVPADGLIGREKLNIYTPLPSSAQVEFVPVEPGVIESGLTAVRERLRPAVQTVQGACVSVKRGSVNLYHAGEDVYYYLKDPPPGFLPRLGTITMAGLLGMFLARKGSGVKRLALPLGLTAAGVSVCYPAQAVAVLKVTGKKVYAAGQWSSAAASSLFPSKPKDDVAKELAASQIQAAPVPKPESEELHSAPCSAAEPNTPADAEGGAAESHPAPPPADAEGGPAESHPAPQPADAEGGPAESHPAPDEPVLAVTTEPSSITHAEISSDQAPPETTKDTAVNSVPAETGPPSEELPEDVSAGDGPDVSESSSEPARPSEEPPAPEPSDPAAAAAAETLSESVASGLPAEESADIPPAAAEGEEPATQTHTPPPPPSESTTETISESVQESGPPAEEPADAPPAAAAAAVEEEEPATPTHTPPPPPSEHATETVMEPVESEPPAEVPAHNPPAAAEEPPTPTHTPEAPSSENTGGSGFKGDPALMDFGQSSPEDADLYTTRS